ncbi:MAG TPA: aldo/keto reductase [Flavisolibacter sp.]|nr:aldo/keto reductase [Flavisolibacter sp.]
MQYRKFGNTDLKVSEIGFGAWAIGGNAKVGNTPIGWGKADDATSRQALQAAVDVGINFFDTADFYGLGHSEILIGEAMKNYHDVVIATKVGHRNSNESIVLDYSKAYIIEACEQSLRRLQRDAIDYYQLHSARISHLQQGECIEAMEQLKQQGKIRYWGLSLNTFHPQPEADFLLQHNYGDGFQLVFNVINQRAMETIKQAGEKGYGLIARMPLQFGLLTGKFSTNTTFSEDDHRHFRLTPAILQQTLQVLEEKVWPLAEKEQMTPTALALSFILNHSAISTVIPGIRTPEHVALNTSGLKQLSAETMQQLTALKEKEWLPVLELMEKAG